LLVAPDCCFFHHSHEVLLLWLWRRHLLHLLELSVTPTPGIAVLRHCPLPQSTPLLVRALHSEHPSF
jgi:hypothetical protein